jgi:hypothetical protein
MLGIIGDIPQAPCGGAADRVLGLDQEQRRLIGSFQWVSLAANPDHVAL